MSKKVKDSDADGKANETEKSLHKAMCTKVNGKSLFDITEEIKATWAVSTIARLKVGRLLCVIVDNEMLKSADLVFSEYVSQFGMKVSLAYLLMRIWRDSEVRKMVQDGLPLQAADSMLGIGSKYGAEYRQKLVDYATGSDGDGGTKNTRALRIKAQEIRKTAKADKAAKAAPPIPMGPQAELQALLAIERSLTQKRKALMDKVNELDTKITANNTEIRRLTAICKDLADDAKPEPAKPNATLAAVKLAAEHDIDLAHMNGSLKNDRISVQDVRDEIASMELDAKAQSG